MRIGKNASPPLGVPSLDDVMSQSKLTALDSGLDVPVKMTSHRKCLSRILLFRLNLNLTTHR